MQQATWRTDLLASKVNNEYLLVWASGHCVNFPDHTDNPLPIRAVTMYQSYDLVAHWLRCLKAHVKAGHVIVVIIINIASAHPRRYLPAASAQLHLSDARSRHAVNDDWQLAVLCRSRRSDGWGRCCKPAAGGRRLAGRQNAAPWRKVRQVAERRPASAARHCHVRCRLHSATAMRLQRCCHCRQRSTLRRAALGIGRRRAAGGAGAVPAAPLAAWHGLQADTGQVEGSRAVLAEQQLA